MSLIRQDICTVLYLEAQSVLTSSHMIISVCITDETNH